MLDGRVLGASQVEYKPFWKPPLKREVLPSAFEDKPLCVPQLTELLSVEEVCADFDAMLRHDWRRLGISAKEVREFCVWRNAPMRVLSLQGDLVDSYDPALKEHRTVCFWPSTGTATCTGP